MEYKFFIPKKHFGLLCELKGLVDKGVAVHYFSGNHDFNLGTFFQEQIGIICHSKQPIIMNLQEKRVCLLHGDAWIPSDGLYRIVKTVLVNPLANWAFKLLHPDLGMKLADFVGSRSRSRHPKRPDRITEYRQCARKLLSKGADILIHGHIHKGFIEKLEEGLYINTGEWLKKMTYVEMINGKCELKRYTATT